VSRASDAKAMARQRCVISYSPYSLQRSINHVAHWFQDVDWSRMQTKALSGGCSSDLNVVRRPYPHCRCSLKASSIISPQGFVLYKMQRKHIFRLFEAVVLFWSAPLEACVMDERFRPKHSSMSLALTPKTDSTRLHILTCQLRCGMEHLEMRD